MFPEDSTPRSRPAKERWLIARGIPLPPVPEPPGAEEGVGSLHMTDADRAYLLAWEARDAEIDRIYAIARRDADGPAVPTVFGDL